MGSCLIKTHISQSIYNAEFLNHGHRHFKCFIPKLCSLQVRRPLDDASISLILLGNQYTEDELYMKTRRQDIDTQNRLFPFPLQLHNPLLPKQHTRIHLRHRYTCLAHTRSQDSLRSSCVWPRQICMELTGEGLFKRLLPKQWSTITEYVELTPRFGRRLAGH